MSLGGAAISVLLKARELPFIPIPMWLSVTIAAHSLRPPLLMQHGCMSSSGSIGLSWLLEI